MKMKVRKKKMGIETQTLRAAILSVEFLRIYQHLYRKGCFTTVFGEWVSETCIEYFRRFQTAPKKDIFDLFRTACVSKRIQGAEQEVLGDFLKSIDFDNPPTINYGYLGDKVRKHFVLQLHRKLQQRLEMAIERGDADLCEEAVLEVKGVKLQTAQICNPFTDKEKVREAFMEEEKPLLKLSGALGKMLNPQFKAGRFIGLLGTAKKGKTWWLYRLAKTAKRFRNNVAVFAAGDEDEKSSIVRFGCMLTGKNNDDEYTGPFAYPVFDCAKNQNGECFKRCRKGKGQLPDIPKEELEAMKAEQLLEKCPKWRVCTVCRASNPQMYEPAVWYKRKVVQKLSWQEAFKAFARFHKFTPKASVKLFTYAANTLSVSEIERQLDMAEDFDGWVPTVVVVDYPDIMKSDSHLQEKRHIENDKWVNLRRLGQQRHFLLIVVSQSNMSGYENESLGAGNVSEDRRKLDIVTAMYALNQTEAEKRKKVFRIGPIVQRKGTFDVEYQIMVLQALEQGNPVVDSQYVYYAKKKNKTDKK